MRTHGLDNEMERKLIQKMASICVEYYEPYDSQDRCEEAQRNAERRVKYNTYKELLLEMWGIKND